MADTEPPAEAVIPGVGGLFRGLRYLNGTRILAVILGWLLFSARADIKELVVRLGDDIRDERIAGRKSIDNLAQKVEKSVEAQEQTAKSVQKLVEHLAHQRGADKPAIVFP